MSPEQQELENLIREFYADKGFWVRQIDIPFYHDRAYKEFTITIRAMPLKDK